MVGPITLIARRTLLLGALVVLPAGLVPVSPARAVDAPLDARFVGYPQSTNNFGIASGKLAIDRSKNENVHGLATRMIAEHTDAAERLNQARADAGVAYVPDPTSQPNTTAILKRLGELQGPEFDTSYANAQLGVLSEAAFRIDVYAQSGGHDALRRYAQNELPQVKAHLEDARRLAGGR